MGTCETADGGRRPPPRASAGRSAASRVTCFRPFPARRARRTALRDAVRSPSSSGPTTRPPHDNPLTREVKAALVRPMPRTGTTVPRVRSASAGLGTRDVARRRPRSPSSTGWSTTAPPADRTSPARDPPPAGARASGPLDAAAGGRLQHARPLGRRLRLGHDQQGHRHHRRRTLRPGRAGLSEVRLGEEGPADDLLPDHRRRADPPARRARARRLRARSTTSRRSARASRSRAWSMAARSSSSRRSRDPEAIWASLPFEARRSILDRRIRVFALDTAELARRHAPRPDLVGADAGRSPSSACSSALTPFAERAGLDRDELLDAVRPGLQRFFGKRGAGVVDANLAVDRATRTTGSSTSRRR